MELRDGFIVGIFNYCDRWCETCRFTSRCRLFADQARFEAATDPAMKAVLDAPPLPQDIPPPAPKWMEELIEEANEEVARMSKEELASFERAMAPEHRKIHERASAYSLWVHQWLHENEQGGNRADRGPADPLAVISWFAPLNGSKIYRALTGLAEFDGDREFPPDHEGSAKVAMIGIERSHGAWLQLVADRRVSESAAAPCIAELVWLGEQLERVFPEARAFVRPGFDEPDAVSRIE